jgi:DNA-binding NarL/FixJ family response regulator
LKVIAESPAVLIYSAYADASLAIAAMVAGADGLVNKAAPADELIDALRIVARGGIVAPPLSPAPMEEAARALDEADLPILGMIASGTLSGEIAEVLGLGEAELAARRAAMVDRLKARLGRERTRSA